MQYNSLQVALLLLAFLYGFTLLYVVGTCLLEAHSFEHGQSNIDEFGARLGAAKKQSIEAASVDRWDE